MKKIYLGFVYLFLFIPISLVYKLLNKPLFIVERDKSQEDIKVKPMLSEAQRYKSSWFVVMLEKIII